MQEKRIGRVISIIGGQYGSEGKGAVAEYLAPLISTSVRIGAANAGHTVMYQGNEFVMRTLPCNWINPRTQLVIGISSMISPKILLEEIEKIDKILPIKNRLFIDSHAHVITDDQIIREQETGLAARISSTSAKAGLGIGMATADKILRSDACVFAKDVPEFAPYLCDTCEFLNSELAMDQVVQFEGTQGFGLDIDQGKFPYVTSRNTTAQALFAGTGVNPYDFTMDTIMVVRAYPIRVGGSSGMFDPDSEEITWQEVARRSGARHDITEKTSVTKTIRRVATFSMQGFDRACTINRPTEIALTFADHIDACVYEQQELSDKVYDFIHELEECSKIPVTLVKTGPKTIIDFDHERSRLIYKLG